jgi:hypothetical protein
MAHVELEAFLKSWARVKKPGVAAAQVAADRDELVREVLVPLAAEFAKTEARVLSGEMPGA